MSRPKPRIYKHAGEWWVALPMFGFSHRHRLARFATWKAACRWLKESSIGGSDGTALATAFTREGAWAADNRPVVYR